MSNYWYWKNGTNTLSHNILSDAQILEFLLSNPGARSDFQDAFEALTRDEDKQRIQNLIDSNPMVKTTKYVDERDVSDAVQRKHNTAGIYVFRR
jgi:hypothetical protein